MSPPAWPASERRRRSHRAARAGAARARRARPGAWRRRTSNTAAAACTSAMRDHGRRRAEQCAPGERSSACLLDATRRCRPRCPQRRARSCGGVQRPLLASRTAARARARPALATGRCPSVLRAPAPAPWPASLATRAEPELRVGQGFEEVRPPADGQREQPATAARAHQPLGAARMLTELAERRGVDGLGHREDRAALQPLCQLHALCRDGAARSARRGQATHERSSSAPRRRVRIGRQARRFDRALTEVDGIRGAPRCSIAPARACTSCDRNRPLAHARASSIPRAL